MIVFEFKRPWMRRVGLLFSLILLAFDLGVGRAYAQTQPGNPLAEKNVLILNAFESNVPAFEKTNQGLSTALQSGGIGIRNQFYEHLHLVRNVGPENRRPMVELMHQRYGRRKIDFIITLYPEGLKFRLSSERHSNPCIVHLWAGHPSRLQDVSQHHPVVL
jgi:hypothetical protein